MKRVAVYFDIENMPTKSLDVDKLMQDLVMQDDSDEEIVLSIRRAYGSNTTNDFKKKLLNQNFVIIDTPHLSDSYSKNRADMFISVDAVETILVDKLPVERYVFATSDSDFTVVATMLRKYGRDVWLIISRTKDRKILNTACSKMLFFEDYIYSSQTGSNGKESSKKNENNTSISKNEAQRLFEMVVSKIDPSRVPFNLSVIYDRMKNLEPGFSIGLSPYAKFSDLATEYENKLLVTKRKNGHAHILVVEIIENLGIK
ncbi:MAG: NYN domain-containing protein [Deltaproteobacteria bacterium]|nr:NYN domain-containing protein [Deltaproteobacteria bacterium]